MDKRIMIFENKEVEVFEYEGRVLFNPKDVAKCLDITDVNSSMRNFNEKQVIKLTNSDMHDVQIRKLNNAGEKFLTESGVYKLIFKSKKEEAEKFQDWVTDEVLPSLRKNGTYSITTPNVNNNLVDLVQATITNIIPLITNEMGKLVLQSQDKIDQSIEMLHNQSVIYDSDRENLKDLIGFHSVNTTRIVKTIKEILSEKLGYHIMANNPIFQKVKKSVFKEFKVIKWEDVPVEKYSRVFAFVDEYISEMECK
jgi:prophage antirepressor-like protein